MITESENKCKLPKGWGSATIPEMIPHNGVFIDGDWVESKDQDPNGDIRLIQLADVGDGVYRNKSSRFLTTKKTLELGCTFLKRGDVLIARMPDPLGRACVFPGDIKEAVTAVDVCIVRTAELGVDNRWLMFATNSPAIRRAIESLQAGTTRKRISRKNLATIWFPLPPANEQKRIVAKIEELFTRLDAGVEALKKVKAELKRYRQAVLKYAFEGKLTAEWRERNKGKIEPASKLLARIAKEREKSAKGKTKELPPLDTSNLPELPGGWEWVTMPQVGEINRGKSRHRPRDAPHLYGGKYPFVQTGDIRNAKGIIKEYTQTYSEEGLRQSRLWPKGTLCITIAANIADTAFLGFDACIPDSVVGFRADERHCNTKFVEFFLRTAKANLERYAPATAQKNINLAILSVVAMPFPSLMEQTQIVEEIERHFSISDEVEQAIEKSLKEADRLRQSILKKAFEGKLVPQDPNDEPAEKLLERINGEKTEKKRVKKTV